MFVTGNLARRVGRSLLAITLVCMASVGCKNLYRFPSAQHAAETSDGRLWLSGSEGFAAVWDGRQLRRDDYAVAEKLPESFYRARSGQVPTARVIDIGGEVQLVTRAGDRYRHTGRSWERIALDLGGGGALRGQVNFAANHEGKLLLYVNDGRLLWVDPASGRQVREEPLYGHVHPMAVHHSAVVGVGYRGKARTLVRRDGHAQWQELARFDADEGEPLALARVADRWLVVLRRGLVTVSDDGDARFIRGDLLKVDTRPHGAVSPLPKGTPLATTKLAEVPTTFGVALGGPGVVVLPVGEGMVVLSEAVTTSAAAAADGAASEDATPARLQWWISGRCAKLNERPFPIPVYGPTARLRNGRVMLATASGKLYALRSGGCTRLSPALIRW